MSAHKFPLDHAKKLRIVKAYQAGVPIAAMLDRFRGSDIYAVLDEFGIARRGSRLGYPICTGMDL